MARGQRTALTLHLTEDQRQTLRAWQRSTTLPMGLARRGRIILLLADGMPLTQIAEAVGISRRFVYKWAQRFLAEGVAGLADKPGRGWPTRPPGAGGHQSTPPRGSVAARSQRAMRDRTRRPGGTAPTVPSTTMQTTLYELMAVLSAAVEAAAASATAQGDMTHGADSLDGPGCLPPAPGAGSASRGGI